MSYPEETKKHPGVKLLYYLTTILLGCWFIVGIVIIIINWPLSWSLPNRSETAFIISVVPIFLTMIAMYNYLMAHDPEFKAKQEKIVERSRKFRENQEQKLKEEREKRKLKKAKTVGTVVNYIGGLVEKQNIIDRYSAYINKHGIGGEGSPVTRMMLFTTDPKKFEIELLKMLINYGETHLQSQLDELHQEPSKTKENKTKCNAILTQYMLKLRRISLNAVKPFLENEVLKDHHQQLLEQVTDVEEFLKKLIEDGIEPHALESLIQNILSAHTTSGMGETFDERDEDREALRTKIANKLKNLYDERKFFQQKVAENPDDDYYKSRLRDVNDEIQKWEMRRKNL